MYLAVAHTTDYTKQGCEMSDDRHSENQNQDTVRQILAETEMAGGPSVVFTVQLNSLPAGNSRHVVTVLQGYPQVIYDAKGSMESVKLYPDNLYTGTYALVPVNHIFWASGDLGPTEFNLIVDSSVTLDR